MRTATRLLSLLFSGLFAGFLACVLVIELSLRAAGASVYTQVRLVELDHLDTLAAATLLPAILATAMLVVQARRRPGWWIPLTALGLLLAVFVLTLTVNLPINHDQATWNPTGPPADWKAVRDRWQIAHAVRTVAAVLAFTGLTTAAARR
jgi:uncharacterized membrane protein